jgi:hypothetical protein
MLRKWRKIIGALDTTVTQKGLKWRKIKLRYFWRSKNLVKLQIKKEKEKITMSR